MNKLPIGVFDSGLGGLTVLKKIRSILPNEDLVYLGDTARVPYGTRSDSSIKKFAIQDLNFLLSKHVKCVVVACNTISSVALKAVQKNSKVKVFDVISYGSKDAFSKTFTGKVGVIGTRATIKSDSYKKTLKALNKKIIIYSRETPLLVPFIEEGEIKGELIEKLVWKYLQYFNSTDIDVLILGCTHYPVIKKIIKKTLPDVEIVDSSNLLAKELKLYLATNKLLNPSTKKGNVAYFVSDLTKQFVRTAAMFMDDKNIKSNISVVNNLE